MSKPQTIAKPIDRAEEISRLKAEFDRCIASGHWELAESYHKKLIELEIPG